ncbi:uncharacterized protein [Choristoneura fumiferana]|uniref:uncharacterized protein n=1 Tax=Choristoneura fumiferana TaxID=7141 RepID=UPI003D15D86D
MHLQLQTATGQNISVQGEQEVSVKIGEKKYWHKVIIADIVDDCIIGLDFMRKYDCKIDLKGGVLKFGAYEVPMEGEVGGHVFCARRTTLQPRSQALVPVKLPYGMRQGSHSCVLIEKIAGSKPWIPARTVVMTSSAAFIRVLNLSDTQHVLSKGTLMGTCEAISWIRSCHGPSENKLQEEVVDIGKLLENCENDLTEEELLKARNLLKRYRSVFLHMTVISENWSSAARDRHWRCHAYSTATSASSSSSRKRSRRHDQGNEEGQSNRTVDQPLVFSQ